MGVGNLAMSGVIALELKAVGAEVISKVAMIREGDMGKVVQNKGVAMSRGVAMVREGVMGKVVPNKGVAMSREVAMGKGPSGQG